MTISDNHTLIPHPRVPITKLSSGYEARCHHCDWKNKQSIRTAVDEQARYHRHLHRNGQITVTGAPQ